MSTLGRLQRNSGTSLPEAPPEAHVRRAGSGYYYRVWRRFRKQRLGMIAAGVLLGLVVACYLVPLALPPADVDLAHANLSPLSAGHVLGTDFEGRDVLVRNLDGGRISILVGLSATVVTLALALVIGMAGGYFGGLADALLTPATNAVLSTPSLLVLVLFGVMFGHGLATVVVGIGFLSWPYPARVIRSVTLSVRERQYVEAANVLGVTPLRILSRHILPSTIGPLVVAGSLNVANAILTESALSFLGLGINPPTATWGRLLDEGRDRLDTFNGFVVELWPGLLIVMTVLCCTYLGGALQDAFETRRRVV
jgi:ABC-type dipeptide/oligopeptide/nickel transport system permease subunit